MVRGKFLIQVFRNNEVQFILTTGYTAQSGSGRYYGIHRYSKQHSWVITELTTGLRVRDGFRSLSEANAALPGVGELAESWIQKFPEKYEDSYRKCRQAYCDYPNQPEIINLFWRIYGWN